VSAQVRAGSDRRSLPLRAVARARTLGRSLAIAGLGVAAGHLGRRLVKDDFYSPLPDLDALPPEDLRSAMAGIHFDSTEQLRYLSESLGPYLGELDIPDAGVAGELYLRNGFYEAGDAETLYAIVRERRPARVLELGSGFSTHIIARALAANGGGTHQVFDPYARPEIDALASVTRRSAGEIEDAEFARLERGDVLFVDSTHVVKIGSEVNRIVLDALPLLAPGVAVHFHDIFLPWDYPHGFFTRLGMYLNEQYLLQALLAMNPGYRILLAMSAVGKLHPQEVAELIPSVRAGAAPCAFWIERAEAAS
jgi:hypothetical protein